MNESGPTNDPQGDCDSITTRQWVEKAIDEHEGSLVRYAQQFVGDLDRARDVVQDTFIQLLKCDRESIQSHLRPWLFKVCRNRAIDVCRKESRMKLTGTFDDQVNGNASPAATAELRDTSVHVRSLIGDLDQRQQELLRLKFQNSMSYKEIASVTGLTVSNVGFILHTAIQKIRKRATAELGVESN
jgi:RNA polymerase sigma-70 factor (ECF subfamily)